MMISLVEIAGAPRVCQLKILLVGAKPRIWRRFLVLESIPLSRLHKVFQIVMGWQDAHLHHFEVGNRRYGQPDMDDEDEKLLDERQYRLSDLARKENDLFLYCYDFGDDWEHEVTLERRITDMAECKHAVCLEGVGACPPEDCGGIHGYHSMLKVLANPQHRDCKDVKRWVGVDWIAERYDMALVNKQLKKIKV